MKLSKFISTLEHGAADLFDFNTFMYPAPFDTLGVSIANKAIRDFGALKLNVTFLDIPLIDLQRTIWEDITLNKYQINALNKILEAAGSDDTTADRTEIRTYGEDKNILSYGQTTITNNVGARSSQDVTGATDGTTTNTDTAFDTITGKTTTTEHTTTQAVTNTSNSQAATDSAVTSQHTDFTTRAGRIDKVEIYGGVGAKEAPEYIDKWLKIKNAPVLVALEHIIIDTLTIPYYEE